MQKAVCAGKMKGQGGGIQFVVCVVIECAFKNESTTEVWAVNTCLIIEVSLPNDISSDNSVK